MLIDTRGVLKENGRETRERLRLCWTRAPPRDHKSTTIGTVGARKPSTLVPASCTRFLPRGSGTLRSAGQARVIPPLSRLHPPRRKRLSSIQDVLRSLPPIRHATACLLPIGFGRAVQVRRRTSARRTRTAAPRSLRSHVHVRGASWQPCTSTPSPWRGARACRCARDPGRATTARRRWNGTDTLVWESSAPCMGTSRRPKCTKWPCRTEKPWNCSDRTNWEGYEAYTRAKCSVASVPWPRFVCLVEIEII